MNYDIKEVDFFLCYACLEFIIAGGRLLQWNWGRVVGSLLSAFASTPSLFLALLIY